jgi:hypothetical protein
MASVKIADCHSTVGGQNTTTGKTISSAVLPR